MVGVRTGDKGRGRDGEPLPNFEPGSDVMAKATVLAEGTLGHLTLAAMDYYDLARRRPAALGARREGGVGGPEAARPRDPHDGLAAAQGRALERVRRQLHLPDGRGQGLHRLRRRARLHGRDVLRPRRAPAVQDAPVRAQDPRRRQARRVGRQDDSFGRLLRDAAQVRRAGHVHRGRRRRHGQHPDAEGHPLRDARGHVRGRGDRRRAEAGLEQLRGLRRSACASR